MYVGGHCGKFGFLTSRQTLNMADTYYVDRGTDVQIRIISLSRLSCPSVFSVVRT